MNISNQTDPLTAVDDSHYNGIYFFIRKIIFNIKSVKYNCVKYRSLFIPVNWGGMNDVGEGSRELLEIYDLFTHI